MSILICIAWHWTIFQSLVSPIFIENLFLLLKTSLATSVHVERVFSQGRILLSHIRSRLSVQSTRALMCLGVWSLMGYVEDSDIKAAAIKPEIVGEEQELKDGWDSI
jgi:hypothetical protein